jgi:hypothetical protein
MQSLVEASTFALFTPGGFKAGRDCNTASSSRTAGCEDDMMPTT